MRVEAFHKPDSSRLIIVAILGAGVLGGMVWAGLVALLRDQGCALLVVSEELDELFEICDRLVVIAQGRVSPSVMTSEATVPMIGEWMSGLWVRGDGPHPNPLPHAGEGAGLRAVPDGERTEIGRAHV